LGSIRQLVDGSAEVTLTQSYEPFGSVLISDGEGESVYQFAGEVNDLSGLTYLRARYYDSYLNQFTQPDTIIPDIRKPQSINKYSYVNNNPINYTDPSGHLPYLNGKPDCPIGQWDCETVENIYALRSSFLASASRHNNIPDMDDNGFAALIAATIRLERRIGNVPTEEDDERNRSIQRKENFVARLGCIVSGSYVKGARDTRDWQLFIRYLTNQEIPEGNPLYTLASVGVGNVKLDTAANIWKGQACPFIGDCTPVQVDDLKTTNIFGWTVDISNPFAAQLACTPEGTCTYYQPTEVQSLSTTTLQLMNIKMNIEYVAANLQVGALRAESLGITPTAFNSATWHLKGVQTNSEIDAIASFGHSVGGAVTILDYMPTALQVLNLTSSWSLYNEKQYWRYK